MQPIISVIVPVYNADKYLSKCLDSIVSQTLKDIEIICINDGSTDNSANVLSEYAAKDSRIKIFAQENVGLSETRNRGIKIAAGEYICFIDSDDYVDLDYFEVLLNLLKDNDADIAMAGMRLVADDNVSENTTPNAVYADFVRKLNSFPNGSVCDKLFKKDLFIKNNLLFPRGRYYEDNIVLLKLAHLSGKCAFTNSVSYYYFMNPTGICRAVSLEQQRKRDEDKLYIADQMMRYAKDNGITGKSLSAVQKFVVRTVVAFFLNKKSKYYPQITEILGQSFMRAQKRQKFVQKIKRFVWRANVVESGVITYKIFKIPIYKKQGGK